MCQTPEQFKAWSQNLGHEDVLTTFTSYGTVPAHRQGELIREMQSANRESKRTGLADRIAKKVAEVLSENDI